MPPKRKAAVDDIPTNTPEPRARHPGPAAVTRADSLPGKRQRVSRACDQCRAAREKCDGKQEGCHSCVSHKRPCTYQANPKKRGVQTGYIRTLEIALGWVFDKVSGSEDALNAALTHLSGGQGHALAGTESAGDGGGGDGERLHKRWQKSRVHQDIDRILSGAGRPASLPQDRCSPDFSDVEPDTLRLGPLAPPESQSQLVLDTALSPEQCLVDHGGMAPRGGPQQPPGPRDSQPPARQSRQLGPPTYIEPVHSTPPSLRKLPANHWRLLDIYFSYTHSWLPILVKQDIFQASYLYSDQGLALDPRSPLTATHAELWSALALAALQDAATASSNYASSTPNSNNDAGLSPIDIYCTARSLIPLEGGPFQIHHSRALILLSLFNMGRGKAFLTPAWLLIGSATRISLDMMARRVSDDDRREWERLQSVLMASFMIDTIISAQGNRPPHLRAEDMHQVFPVQEDGLDQWEPWAACAGFGPNHQGNRVARSPAYCLSAFNQLYRVLKLVSQEISLKTRRLTCPGGPTSFLSELRQAVDSSSPFGIASSAETLERPMTASSPVPTAYLVRAIYLWAAALLTPQTGSWLGLLEETLEEYSTRFGACCMPTIVTPCLASLATVEGYSGPSHLGQGQLEKLFSNYSTIWAVHEETEPEVTTMRPIPQIASIFAPSATPRQPPAPKHSAIPPLATLSSPSSSSLYESANLLQPPRFPPGVGPYNASTTITNYRQPPAAIPHLNQPYGHVQMMGDLARGTLPANQISMSQQERHGIHSTTQFDDQEASIDYDAILDDLASIDCADPVAVDPRFMANLGYILY